MLIKHVHGLFYQHETDLILLSVIQSLFFLLMLSMFACAYFVIRALVDMLRHQSSPVQQDERNNSVALTVGDGQGTLGRAQKNLYAPGLPSKDNRCEGLDNESEA